VDNPILLGIAAFVVVDILLLAWIFWCRRRPRFSADDLQIIATSWQKITATKNREGILEADKLLDFTLKKLGFTGTLGEKLKRSGKVFSDLDGVWQAHRLRNQIAHELDFSPSAAQISRALGQFQRALYDLKALKK